MTMTIMYLTVAFLLAALAVSAYARVRGLDFDRGGSPLDIAVILLVIGLVIDLAAQLTIGSQGWLNSDQQWRNAVQGPPKLPSLFLWKIGLAAQSIAAIFLVLGIWRLFAAVGQLVPAARARLVRASAVTPADTAD